MTHLSTLQVKQLCASSLPEDELVTAALHCAECQSCHQQFVEGLKRQRGSAPSSFTLDPEFWFRNDHVDFDHLVALADKTVDQTTEEIISIHLKTCEACREDVRNFLAFRNATARELDVSYDRPEYQPIQDVAAAPWRQSWQLRPVYAVAAILLVAVAVLIGLIALNRRSASYEAKKQDQASPGVEPNVLSSPGPNVISSPSTAENTAKVVLNDAGGEVTIDTNRHVTGLDEISENSRQIVARAALSEQIEPADVLSQLSGEPSGLRGDDEGKQEFRLLYPARRVLMEDRPNFRWKSLPGASSYRVYVVDANGKQIHQSEDLSPTQTQWKAPAPLRRGQVYSWLVMATADGKKVVSPSVSEPEIKFAVLSTADAQELGRLKRTKSHLALGIFYARAGLLDEADRELQTLIKLNPDSELPKKLLQGVRGMMKGN